MPHAALKLVGGVNTQETPTQNENGGISASNLIRYFYDPNGLSLVAKLGGWTPYYSAPMDAPVRALLAWEDLNANSRLAVGTQTATDGSARLNVITSGSPQLITPTINSDNLPVYLNNETAAVASTAGSASIVITDGTVTGITPYNTVFIATQIAIGGIVLYGTYMCDPDGYLEDGSYTVYARDLLGNLTPATSTSSFPFLPYFTTTGSTVDSVFIGSPTVNVELPNYTYAVGDSFPVLNATTVGGITFYGNYVVQSLVDANNFTITAGSTSTSVASGSINGNLVNIFYFFGQGSLPGGTGYGAGYYGQGPYGEGTPVVPSTGSPIDAIDWSLDNYGQTLISCPVRNQPATVPQIQPLFQWSETTGQATIITNAPIINDGFFVAMPQRQLVAWGSTATGVQDPLLINWSDIGNYNQWIPLVTNQAGSYRLPKGSTIVSCLQGPQQALILTDIDAWSMQYIGQPYVYSFNEIGTGCGLISRKALAAVRGTFFWMGYTQFYMLNADGVQTVQCSVWDFIFQNLKTAINPVTAVPYTANIRVAVNSRFDEIQWFFPSASGTGENDSYVKYNIDLGVWDCGTLGRSAWVDQSVLGPPIGADPVSLMLYQHETSNDAAGVAMTPYFQTGNYALSEGDYKSFVDWVWPDMKWGTYGKTGANVQISFYVSDYPGDTPAVYGPYNVTQATEYFYTRFRGRLVSVRVASNDLGSFWRVGLIRYRYAPDGQI